jgi:hypothetical protein
LFEHCVLFGWHAAQVLAVPPSCETSMQKGVLPPHVVPVPHFPVESQVWTAPAEHRVAPGTHVPPHAGVLPPMHTYGQATGADHAVPPELHVWTPLLEHCVLFGTQEPEHCPASPASAAGTALQMLAQAGPLSCQAPVRSQTCG